jgi:hypothetical protein
LSIGAERWNHGLVGTLDVGIMNSKAFFLLSKGNSKINGNQITFGAADFQPHKPTPAPV